MQHTDVDWERVERSPDFEELVRRRYRFVIPATIFFLAWFIGFILLAGYAPDFMAESVYEGLTVGYCLALSQFLMVWGLSWLYLRKADREFDPLQERAVRSGEQMTVAPAAPREEAGRFQAAPPAPDGTAPVPEPTTTTTPGGASS